MQNINGWYLLDDEADKPLLDYANKHFNTPRFRAWHEYLADDIINVYMTEDMDTRVAIDVGANVGMMTIPFARDFQEVHCFEINPAVRECLKNNTLQYSNVTVYDCGLSSVEGTVDVEINQWSGLTKVSDKGTVQLPVRTLDSYAFECVDLIKLDVEWHEYQVLLGAKETIARCNPLIVLEHHTSRTKNNMTLRQLIFNLLFDLGYVIIDVRHTDFVFRRNKYE